MQVENTNKSNLFDRILQIADFYRIKNITSFAKDYLGYNSSQKINRLKEDGNNPSYEILIDISNRFDKINPGWLLTGEGDMLKDNIITNSVDDATKNLIPFYDDVVSFGGTNEYSANLEGIAQSPEYIDAGDWFTQATSAIRHYGESMTEYPSGCILALKEVQDINLVVWGKNYMIETTEYRITKRLQKGCTPDFVCAYSSNKDTYPDGRLIHEPIDIPKASISKLALVLGYVVKQNSSGVVYINKKQ